MAMWLCNFFENEKQTYASAKRKKNNTCFGWVL